MNAAIVKKTKSVRGNSGRFEHNTCDKQGCKCYGPDDKYFCPAHTSRVKNGTDMDILIRS